MIGFAIGFASATAPVYISEIAPPDIRGRLVTFFQLAVTIGILVAYLVGLAFEPSRRLALDARARRRARPLLAGGMLRMPQSPRWLVMEGRDYDARATLEQSATGGERRDRRRADRDRGEQLGIEHRQLERPAAPAIKAALMVGIGLAILQQITGINTVIYYAPTIIQDTGIDSVLGRDPGLARRRHRQRVMTVVALRLLDKRGRRTLLLIGVAGMSLSPLPARSRFQSAAPAT